MIDLLRDKNNIYLLAIFGRTPDRDPDFCYLNQSKNLLTSIKEFYFNNDFSINLYKTVFNIIEQYYATIDESLKKKAIGENY